MLVLFVCFQGTRDPICAITASDKILLVVSWGLKQPLVATCSCRRDSCAVKSWAVILKMFSRAPTPVIFFFLTSFEWIGQKHWDTGKKTDGESVKVISWCNNVCYSGQTFLTLLAKSAFQFIGYTYMKKVKDVKGKEDLSRWIGWGKKKQDRNDVWAAFKMTDYLPK